MKKNKRKSLREVLKSLLALVGISFGSIFFLSFTPLSEEDKYCTIDDKYKPMTERIIMSLVSKEEPDFYSMTPKEGLMLALEYYEVHHPDIVYAQSVLETGNFKSSLCVKGNNLFGLYDSHKKRYHRFEHWIDSVKAYKKWIQEKWREGEDYYQFLRRIRYATNPNYISELKRVIKYSPH